MRGEKLFPRVFIICVAVSALAMFLETHPESPPVTALSSFGGPNDRIEE